MTLGDFCWKIWREFGRGSKALRSLSGWGVGRFLLPSSFRPCFGPSVGLFRPSCGPSLCGAGVGPPVVQFLDNQQKRAYNQRKIFGRGFVRLFVFVASVGFSVPFVGLLGLCLSLVIYSRCVGCLFVREKGRKIPVIIAIVFVSCLPVLCPVFRVHLHKKGKGVLYRPFLLWLCFVSPFVGLNSKRLQAGCRVCLLLLFPFCRGRVAIPLPWVRLYNINLRYLLRLLGL